MRSLLIVCALASPAHAEPIVRPLASVNGAWVVTPPELAADLNARIAKDWRAKPAGKNTSWVCKVGYMTDALVSWRCEGGDKAATVGSSVGLHRTFWIRDGKLVPFDISAEVKSMTALAEAMHTCGRSPSDPLEAGVFISYRGIEVYHTETADRGCVHNWPTVYKALRTDQTLATIARTAPGPSDWENAFAESLLDSPLPKASTEKTPSTRFVAVGDYGVRDTSTGLTWIARQPPDEVNAAQAAGRAAAYRGGGHSDWRLPRIGELAALSTADLAHTEAGDCTGGKSKYTITPLIHLSCGLAWSVTTINHKTAAWGFISGTARLADSEERKNYRALMVRGPD